MDPMKRQLDAEQYRRRRRLLADLAQAKAARLRRQSGLRGNPIRELVARRRPAS
jgi:hypothetical protein